MPNFMKDIKKLASTAIGKSVIEKYEQGLITLPEAVERMYNLNKLVDMFEK